MFQFLLTIPRSAVSLMSLVFALFQGNLQLSQERKERKKNTKKFFEKVEKDRNKKEWKNKLTKRKRKYKTYFQDCYQHTKNAYKRKIKVGVV